MFNLDGALWFGSEDSLNEASRIETHAKAQMLAHPNFMADSNDAPGAQPKLPSMYSKQGSVGVVTVRGPLINADAMYTRYLGIATYAAIREALVYAATDNSIDSILLDMDSGGGAVSGVDDSSQLLAMVGKVKPVVSYSENIVASAAYWMSSQASKVYAGRLATVGSIGVIATHMDYSEALKKEGVKATVLRSGKFKALVSPLEPLSDEARKQLQAQMDATHAVFTQVALVEGRGMSPADANKLAEGQTFMGAEAQKVGLIDGVSTFDKVLAQMMQKSVDNTSASNNTKQKRGLNYMKSRAALPEHLVTAISSGIELSAEQKAQIEAHNAANPELTAEEKVAADLKAKADAEAAAKVEADAKAAAELKAKQDAEAAALAADAAPTVKLLREQLAEKDAKVLEVSIQNKALTDKVSAMEATHKPMVEIVRNSLTKMSVALGGTDGAFEALSDEDVVKQHASISESFKNKFKVGGVASTKVEDAGQRASAAPAATPEEMARMNATGLNKK